MTVLRSLPLSRLERFFFAVPRAAFGDVGASSRFLESLVPRTIASLSDSISLLVNSRTAPVGKSPRRTGPTAMRFSPVLCGQRGPADGEPRDCGLHRAPSREPWIAFCDF